MTPPSQTSTARSIVLPSSRTLPGPVIAGEHVDRGRRDAADVLAVLARVALQEVIGQQHDVRLPLAQRRREDREDREPVVQVGPERALLDEVLERPMGGGDQPDVDLDRRGAAEPLDFPLLQDAQQLHLRRGTELADLVEEERAAVGQLEAALSWCPARR